MNRRRLGPAVLAVSALLALSCCGHDRWRSSEPVGTSEILSTVTPRDPLPSWGPGLARQAIIDTVIRATSPGSASLVPEDERIAVFDDDGTLRPERPLAEAAFTISRLKAEVVGNPELAREEPYRSILDNDAQKLSTFGREAILRAVGRTHSGITDEALELSVHSFLLDARHPMLDAPYPTLTYQPMLELLDYLRAHKFTIYLSTASDQAFARAIAPASYGIARDHVIGSAFEKQLVVSKDRADLVRKPELSSLNDGEAKAVNLQRRIGERPVVAVGRVGTGGDVAMLSYTRKRAGASLALVLLHDVAERELAYDEPDGATLAAAREHGFVVVSMKHEWSQVFGPEAGSARSRALAH